MLISKALDYDFIKHIYLEKEGNKEHSTQNTIIIDIDADKLKSLDKIIFNIKHNDTSTQ